MTKGKKTLIMTAVFSLLLSSNIYAVSKVNKVNVRFEMEGYDTDGFPLIDADAKGSHYQVDLCESAEVYYDSGSDNPYEDERHVYITELSTEDGYQFRFTSSDKNRINLSGVGAELLKAEQRDNGHTLRIYVRLEDLEDYVGPIEAAFWNNCHGEWTASENASNYEVRIIRPSGNKQYAVTAGLIYDFSPWMTEEGSYRFEVRGVSNKGNNGDWTEGGSITIGNEIAARNKDTYAVQTTMVKIDPSMPDTPDNYYTVYLNTGWQINAQGKYWYRNCDGSYPQGSWQMIDGSWYYFGQDGYLCSDTYLMWGDECYYLTKDGWLLTNSFVPDGRLADENGVLMEAKK